MWYVVRQAIGYDRNSDIRLEGKDQHGGFATRLDAMDHACELEKTTDDIVGVCKIEPMVNNYHPEKRSDGKRIG